MSGHYRSCPDPADCWCKVRRYSHVLIIASIIVAVQVSVGLYFDIVSLVSDGGHTATHSAAYFVALIAAILAVCGFNGKKTDRIASLIVIGFLFLSVPWIVFEAMDRLMGNEKHIVGWIMALGGIFGFIGNHIEHRILENAADEHKDHTHKGTIFHVKTDRALSCAVFVGGVTNHFTGWTFIDPVVSLLIAAWIFVGAVDLVRQMYTDGNIAAP